MAVQAFATRAISATVLVVDRDPVELDRLRDMFGDAGYQLLATTTAVEALCLVEHDHVDLAVVDTCVADADGLDVVVDIRRANPNVIRILTTATPCIDSAVRAINEAAVHRYLTKPCNRDVLLAVVRDVLELRPLPSTSPLASAGLSPRLKQTLEALMTAASEKQIAHQLGISPHTAHQYVKTLFRRFRVTSRAELMAKALQRS